MIFGHTGAPTMSYSLARARAPLVLFFTLVLLVLPGPGGVQAQAAVNPPPEQISDSQLQSLVQTIEDDERRAEFLRQLKALIAAGSAREAAAKERPRKDLQAVNLLAERIDALSRELLAAAESLLRLPQLAAGLGTRLVDAAFLDRALPLLTRVVLILIVAGLFDALVRRLLRGIRARIESRAVDNMLTRVTMLSARTLLELIPVGVFAVVAYFVMPLLDTGPQVRALTLVLVNAVVVYRGVMALARMLLTPAAVQLRMLPMTDMSAQYWFIWCRRLTSVVVFGYFFTVATLILDLPHGPQAIIGKLLGLLVAGLLAVLVQQNRDALAHWLKYGHGPAADIEAGSGADGSLSAHSPMLPVRSSLQWLRERIAASWHVLAVVYIFAGYAIWALEIPGGFRFLLRATVLSVVVLGIAGVLAQGLRWALENRFAIPENLLRRFPLLEARANRYLPLLTGALNGGIWILAGFSILQAWDLNVLGWLGGGSGQRLLAGAITIGIILLAALLAWEVVSYLIERSIERTRVENDAQQNARIMTLLPLARRTFLLVLVIMVLLMVLSEFGINIAPLLAGAGVIGLAIGFGAQTLVKDVITGLFILIENTIAVGDYIDVGGHEGTVESLTIRSVRLRDAAANVHTVPFSEVSSVLNYTRDYSYAVLNIGVAYRESVDEVMAVIRDIGEEMRADPDVAADIIEPLQVQGVNALEDSAVVIRARIKVKAGCQWAMRRQFNRRMKNRFDELGIEIPFPHQTVYFGVDAQGQAPAAQVQVRYASESPAVATQSGPRPGRAPDTRVENTGTGQRISDHDIDQGGGME